MAAAEVMEDMVAEVVAMTEAMVAMGVVGVGSYYGLVQRGHS